MSRNKRGGGADHLYSEHYFGSLNSMSNVPIQRQGQIIRNHERLLSEAAMNRFEWKNLPDSISPRFLEQCLFLQGVAIAYFDRRFNEVLVVRGSGQGYVNAFDDPISFNVIAPGSAPRKSDDLTEAHQKPNLLPAYQPQSQFAFSPEELKKKAVGIWPNFLRFPELDIVRMYATRLGWIDHTLEINSLNARRNKVVKGTEEIQLSLMNIGREVELGNNLMMLTGPLEDMEFIEALDLGVTPDSYEKLALLRTRIWNEVHQIFGIDGSNQDKKERLVAAEVGANDAQADTYRYVALNARQYAAEQINKCFGLNIEVGYRVEFEREEAEEQAQELAEEQDIAEDDGRKKKGDE